MCLTFSEWTLPCSTAHHHRLASLALPLLEALTAALHHSPRPSFFRTRCDVCLNFALHDPDMFPGLAEAGLPQDSQNVWWPHFQENFVAFFSEVIMVPKTVVVEILGENICLFMFFLSYCNRKSVVLQFKEISFLSVFLMFANSNVSLPNKQTNKQAKNKQTLIRWTKT